MTDPVTNNYGLTLPTVGGDTNTWGVVLNSGVISALDAVLGNNLSIPITSADVSLTDAQTQNAIFVLSGALTGNHNLILPLNNNSGTVAVGGKWIVVNDTTGNFNVTVITAAVGSTGVTVPQGFAAEIYSDGTNVNYATSGLPAYLLASNGNPNSQLAGTAGSVNTNPSIAFDFVNGIIYVCTTTGTSTTAVWSTPTIVVPRGFDMPINLGLTVTHTGGNLLNLAIKQSSGVDATALSPIIVPFQTLSGSNTTGLPALVNVTSALSMNTFATGASFGATNSTPFRIWFALFNNSGVIVPAMRMCSTASGSIFGTAEFGVDSTVAVSGSATSAGVWYTPNGTTLTNCAYRVIGYSEYLPGNLLATAGTYSADPSNTVLYGPGIQLPGQTVKSVIPNLSSIAQVTLTTATSTNVAGSITLKSAVNLVRYYYTTDMTCGASNPCNFTYQLYRGSTAIGNLAHQSANPNTVGYGSGQINGSGIDNPGTTSTTTYTLKGTDIAGAAPPGVPNLNPGAASMILDEIMG